MASSSDMRPAWFVGSSFGGWDDQTDRFLSEGIWENGYRDQYIDQVKSILPGDRIAIKSAYTRKRMGGLPFDNRGHSVSVMAIKATGTVLENLDDGRHLKVAWTPVEPRREWYFYTSRITVWEVYPDHWMAKDLTLFTFDGQDQDIDRFRNAPYWKDRFGAPEDTGTPIQSPPGPVSDPNDSEFSLYTIDDLVEDGCFLEESNLSELLERFEEKQNLILQGPPGTGKTWLAKRLAYALIGRKDTDKVRSVQFHPNMSYEDFVRGYRPSGDGKLELVDGPFIEMIDAAKAEPTSKYVIVIEEINRGNPAQIFGEMLTLLEADKRTPDEALELTYRKCPGERVHIPENLYVIGTMNMADRSLAMVDFALRRRFAFVNMEPALNERWLGWVHEHCDIDPDALSQIKAKLDSLNQAIADDPNLGPQFRIGHSFVTPNDKIDNVSDWFRQVVETEIGPLLDEYWYDDREKAREERNNLLSGI